MPQMAPMWWSSMFIFFILTYIIVMMVIYFYNIYNLSLTQEEMMKSAKNLFWKW